MNYIVDKNGKELNGKSNHKKRSWISQNMIAALTMIPIDEPQLHHRHPVV